MSLTQRISTLLIIMSFAIFPFIQANAAPSVSSLSPAISADGSYVTFQSGRTDLVLGDTNGQIDVFLRDLLGKQTTRVSVDSTGTQGNNNSGSASVFSISSDGRYIAFSSNATNLVAGDTNGATDIFLHDTQTGDTTRVSVDSLGAEGDGASSSPSMSADGRYIAFRSLATNLIAGDTNDTDDIFLHDTQTGDTTRVSVGLGNVQGNSYSSSPSVSSDGRYIAFTSDASNLVAGDSGVYTDIFLHDIQTGNTARVSVDSLGAEGGGTSSSPSISSDGRYIAFNSNAINLVVGDTNITSDIFLHDIQTGNTARVSVDSLGAEGNSLSTSLSISSDGRYIAFSSNATNLVAGDTNGVPDIFLHDIQTGDTTRVSVDSLDGEGNGASLTPSISADGRYVTFSSESTNLISGDINGIPDIFLHDIQTGETILVSRSTNASIAYSGSFTESVANDGSVDGSIIATLTLDTFINTGGTLTLDTHYTLTDILAGLTPVMTINGDGTTATLTFTGNATNHEDLNDVLDLTITFFDDAFAIESFVDVVNYEYTTGSIDFDDAVVEEPTPTRRSSGSSTSQSRSQAKAAFESYYESQGNTSSNNTPSEGSTLGSGQCPANLIVTQNLKQGAVDGQYHPYTGETVDEVALVQSHINSILANYFNQAAGFVDGYFGPQTKQGVQRLQQTLQDEQGANLGPAGADGIVGPMTRAAINGSCREEESVN